MYVLGLEGTAHTAGVGIFEYDGKHARVVFNARRTYRDPTGGIHPREAAQFIAREIPKLLNEAFKLVPPSEISAIGFSRGPGLGPCLRTVATAARFLSSYLNVPLYGINHAVAHIEIGRRHSGFKEPIALYLSGGNTAVVGREERRYVVYGETLDIGLGNLLDTFAREVAELMGRKISFPGGPYVEQRAKKSEEFFEDFPYVVKGMNLSYSGLLNAALRKLKELLPKRGEQAVYDVAYTLQEVAFSMAIEVLERAMGFTGKREVLLVGGVAQNKRLQEMFFEMASEWNAKADIVPPELAADNGAMIAYVALELHLYDPEKFSLDLKDSRVRQRRRMEEFELPPSSFLPR